MQKKFRKTPKGTKQRISLDDYLDGGESVNLDDFEKKSWISDNIFNDTDARFGTDIPFTVDPRLLKSIYMTQDWVYILVDKLAMRLCQIPFQVFRKVTKNGETIEEPALDHPVQKMLDYPNPLQPAYSFKYALITDHAVTGNAFIFHAEKTNQLVQVPSEILYPDINGDGTLLGYDLIGYDPMSFPAGAKMKLAPRDMIHVMRPNSSSVYWGLSPLIPGQSPTLFNRYTNEYLINFYRKGAQPSYVIELGEDANEANAKRLLTTMEATSTGRRNQRRGIILPKGAKYHEAENKLADQNLEIYITKNRETLINIWSIPKHELSLAEAGSLGSEEAKTAIKNFWTNTLIPIGNMFDSALTQRLRQKLGPNYIIRSNYSNVAILQEDLQEKANTANTMLGTMTYNEVRQRIWKLPPIPGGDVLRDLRQPSFPGFGSEGLENGNQEIAEVSESTEDDQKSLFIADDTKVQNLSAFANYTKGEGRDWWERESRRQEQQSEKAITALERSFLKMLEEQILSAANIARNELNSKSRAKADVPNEKDLRRRLEAAMDRLKSKWLKDYNENLIDQVELGYDNILRIPFNQPYQDELEAIRARNRSGRRESLSERGLKTFAYMSETTTEAIMRVIENGLSNSQTLQQIGQKIKDIAKVSASRAMTIARTEALTASSIGQAAAMQDASNVIPKMVKVWINANDDRVRGNPGGKYPDSKADHWSLQGEVVDYDKEFSNGLSYPRDTKGSAGEVINCRCTFLAVSEDDLNRLGIKR